jgi:hypothetical protein
MNLSPCLRGVADWDPEAVTQFAAMATKVSWIDGSSGFLE